MTYLVCNSSMVNETEESRGDIETSMASRKVVEGDECTLEFQYRRIFAFCYPMSHTG